MSPYFHWLLGPIPNRRCEQRFSHTLHPRERKLADFVALALPR